MVKMFLKMDKMWVEWGWIKWYEGLDSCGCMQTMHTLDDFDNLHVGELKEKCLVG